MRRGQGAGMTNASCEKSRAGVTGVTEAAPVAGLRLARVFMGNATMKSKKIFMAGAALIGLTAIPSGVQAVPAYVTSAKSTPHDLTADEKALDAAIDDLKLDIGRRAQ